MEIQSLQLLHPFEYAHSQPVPLTRPQHFHSFSYGEDRELLVDATNKDASLRWYKQPVLYVFDTVTTSHRLLTCLSSLQRL